MKKKYIIILVMMIAMIGICTYCNAFTLPTMSMKDMTIMGNTSGGFTKFIDNNDDLPIHQLIMFKFICPISSVIFAILFSRAAIKKANIKVVITLAVVLALCAISTVVGSIIIHF